MMNSDLLLKQLINASTTADIEGLLRNIGVVSTEQYHVDYGDKIVGEWQKDRLHWLPVGGDRGNGGRIKLAGKPTNPIAERLVNGMEALIELMRLIESSKDPASIMPTSPREAVLRYFGLPRLDSIPHISNKDDRAQLMDTINRIRKMLYIQLLYDKKLKEFSVAVTDKGMGQEPNRIHDTLLSLGQTDKADKPYMIGVFGQGGSSAFAASNYSVILSRRASELVGSDGNDGIGWTIVRQVFPKGRRDNYFAYLAAKQNGEVPQISGSTANSLGFTRGSRFTHIGYNFAQTSSGVARVMYQALNHVLFNPLLPYDLFTLDKERPELMQGTAQRLALRASRMAKNPEIGHQAVIDKSFAPQPVG